MASDSLALSDPQIYGYQAAPTVPNLCVRVVATAGVAMAPITDPLNAPQWLRNELTHWAAEDPRSVLVLDLGDARWEVETLLRMLTSAASALSGALDGDVVMVIATTQAGVAEVVRMVATHVNVPLYLAQSSDRKAIAKAVPAGRLTPTERETLELLSHMGGRATASRFAEQADIELNAAGNRLVNLAKRGYVNRVSKSRRMGDEYVSPAWFEYSR